MIRRPPKSPRPDTLCPYTTLIRSQTLHSLPCAAGLPPVLPRLPSLKDCIMKAVALTRYLPVSDPDAFLDVDLPKPVPQGRDILVAVKAVAVNPVDVKVRAPKDKAEASPRVIGYDASGVVEAVGPQATLFKAGAEEIG